MEKHIDNNDLDPSKYIKTMEKTVLTVVLWRNKTHQKKIKYFLDLVLIEIAQTNIEVGKKDERKVAIVLN